MEPQLRKSEHCYGVIPLRKKKNGWEVLLVHHLAGHWAFPKGHGNAGEDPHETAKRELMEETGLSVHRFLWLDPLQEEYFFIRDGKQIDKQVDYYVAEVEGEGYPQMEEISEVRWIALSEAESLATFPESKRLCLELIELLA